jgi:hypothetical protein
VPGFEFAAVAAPDSGADRCSIVVISISGRAALLASTIIAAAAVQLAGQSVTVAAAGDALRVRAPGFSFLQGKPLERLKDGRSVRFDFVLTVLAKPGAAAAAQGRSTFIMSYDLWEERFAVTRVATPGNPATPSRSISHLTSPDAAAWCLEQLSVPVSALGRLGRDAPFWIRLEYRVQDRTETDGDAGFTLRSLIDTLSMRRKADELNGSIEAGPFRLSN